MKELTDEQKEQKEREEKYKLYLEIRCIGFTEAAYKDYSSNKEKYFFQNKLLDFLRYK